jgi:hypothetical protein
VLVALPGMFALAWAADWMELSVLLPPWLLATTATVSPGPAGSHKLRMADDRCVRNEFLETKVDPQSGGLKAIRDMRMRVPRLGQQLVSNPGNTMRAKELRITSAGPALGEIISEGALR